MRIFKSNSKMVMALSLLGVIAGSFVVSDVLDRVGLKEGMENEEKNEDEEENEEGNEEEPLMEEEIDTAMEKAEEEPVEEGMGCKKKEGMKNKDCDKSDEGCPKYDDTIEPAAAPSSLGLFKF